MGDDGIGARGAQVNGRQALQDFVGQAVGRGQGQLERGVIGYGGAIESVG